MNDSLVPHLWEKILIMDSLNVHNMRFAEFDSLCEMPLYTNGSGILYYFPADSGGVFMPHAPIPHDVVGATTTFSLAWPMFAVGIALGIMIGLLILSIIYSRVFVKDSNTSGIDTYGTIKFSAHKKANPGLYNR